MQAPQEEKVYEKEKLIGNRIDVIILQKHVEGCDSSVNCEFRFIILRYDKLDLC